jgi:ribosome-associated toxin RatA of RatAB toxin-antitoxin module
MTLRGVVVFACLTSLGAGTGCVNASQPRSPRAARDQVVVDTSATSSAASTPSASGALAGPATPRRVDLAEVETIAVAGSSLGRQRATVMVRAAADRVRAVLFDFANYPAFLPNYKSAKVVGTTPAGGTQVHMQIDALGGMIRRWMRIELTPPVVAGDRESFEARLLEGDVKTFQARWVLERLADGTRLTLESFLDANLQLPAAFIDAGSAAGLKESILAIKARAEESP